MSDDNENLRQRMADIEKSVSATDKKGKNGKTVGIVAAALLAAGGGYLALNSLSQPVEQEVAMPSNAVQDFPEDRAATDALEMPMPVEPIIVERSVVTTQTDSATLARLGELETELLAARAAVQESEGETERERELRTSLQAERDKFAADIAALRSTAENDQEQARVVADQLQDQITAFRQEIADASAASDRAMLEQELEFQKQLFAAQLVDPLEQERLRLAQDQLANEQKDRERLEALRAERAQLEAERANSPMVAVGNGGATEAGAAGEREISDAEAFVRRVVAPVAIARATRITAPQATIPQGSIIQASLETAVDSTLPGPIRGVVSEDVHSMDGSAVLIPAGSKVFGEYSSGIDLGQQRILIVWTRILTPSNRSIDIASYGADQLGRSGTGGAVDTRFGLKFSSAALLSIIGAGPAIVAARQDNENTADAVAAIGEDFSDAADTAIGEYMAIPPTIYVRQGTSVTLIVDRDLEIF